VHGGVDLDTDEISADGSRGHASGSRAGERIEHEAATRAERLDQWGQHADGLLSRMKFVARIHPVDHVTDRMFWRDRVPLGQQVGALMLVTKQSRRRRVAFRKRDVPDDPKARRLPCVEKEVGAGPAVERHTEPVITQESEHFLEGGFEPMRTVVTGERSARSVAIAHEIRRIGQHEIHGLGRQGLQGLAAVSKQDLIDGQGHGVLRHRLVAARAGCGADALAGGSCRAHGEAGAVERTGKSGRPGKR